MTEKAGITIVGLGPGDPGQLTRSVWEWLQKISDIYLRTRQHPTVAGFPSHLKVHSFDSLYEEAEDFEAVYSGIVDRVLELGQRPEGVTYAVPGHPFVAEATSPAILQRAAQAGVPVKVLDGLSFLEPVFNALQIDPFPQAVLFDAIELGMQYMPPFPPSLPVVIAQIYSKPTAANLKLTLSNVYPDEHPVRLVHAAGTSQQVVEDLPLYAIDRSKHIGLLSVLYVPPLEKDASFEDFQDIIAHLRAPEGCPWDREQTHQSLRTNLLEETYEALAAIDANDTQAMAEEFGDLLLQIVLHAQIGSEEGEFDMVDVLQGISRKLVRRHPHVFGDVSLKTAASVLHNWEKIKESERKQNKQEKKGLLDSVPAILPSLSQAQNYQERVGRVGFDWPEIDPVVEKVREEMTEVVEAQNDEERASELGDLLFAVVNWARWLKVDAESALRQTNQRFLRRFSHVEQRAAQQGRRLSDMTLQEMDVFWEEAKNLEDI